MWAPGEAIVSTVPNGGYTPFSGTSMAAPQVAGLLTLAKAIEAVREAHSYEGPVITVSEVWASRADYSGERSNPNRWWNRGFDV